MFFFSTTVTKENDNISFPYHILSLHLINSTHYEQKSNALMDRASREKTCCLTSKDLGILCFCYAFKNILQFGILRLFLKWKAMIWKTRLIINSDWNLCTYVFTKYTSHWSNFFWSDCQWRTVSKRDRPKFINLWTFCSFLPS